MTILSSRWRRRWGRFGLGSRFGLGRRLPAALGATTDIDHRAVAPLHFGIHPAQNQNATIEQDHFAVLRAARRIFCRADKGLAALRALKRQLGRCRLVREMHHDAAGRAERNDVRLIAAPGGSRLGARAVLLLVIGRKSTSSADVLRREGRWQCWT